jgi:hypothetical protein
VELCSAAQILVEAEVVQLFLEVEVAVLPFLVARLGMLGSPSRAVAKLRRVRHRPARLS